MKYSSDREAINYARDQMDASRYRKLIRLTGTTRDGSHTRVVLYWNDATNSSSLTVGNSTSYGSFDLIVDSFPED